MDIQSFIKGEMSAPRLQKKQILAVYDPDCPYRDLCQEMTGEKRVVVDASESSVISRAEAFHHQLKHTNRFEEVSKRIKLGKAVEGRDEKSIMKTVSTFLKIMHPVGAPTDDEFEEYVACAVEGRRRVKEQMNKRKSDDEYALINLSYINKDDKDIVVYCRESKGALATQEPVRQNIHGGLLATDGSTPAIKKIEKLLKHEVDEETIVPPPETAEIVAAIQEPQEQHYTIHYGATGYSSESILTPYLKGAKSIEIDDPYVRVPHQIQNFNGFRIVFDGFASIITDYNKRIES